MSSQPPSLVSRNRALPAVTVQLGPRHRYLLYAAFTLMTLSGIGWLLGHYLLRADPDFPHWLEAWSMKVHGGAVMLGLLGYGSVLPHHVRLAWRLGRNLGSGIVLGVASLVLLVSGYALYYVAGETSRHLWSLAHWIIGLSLPVQLLWHIVRGRQMRLHAVRSEAASEEASARPQRQQGQR